ncbi:MAG TPA: recombinase family protein [Abditibacteriaceae bacterium]
MNPHPVGSHPASKLRYALYARKSHDDTGLTEKSLKDQVTIWQQLGRERGYRIVREYRESKSAKDPGVRPLYADMVRRIRRGEIDGILTWHINPLARNMDEGGTLAHLLIGGTLQEIRTPTEVYRSGENIIPLILQHAIATQNNLDHALAVRRGMNSRLEEGGWTHRAPVGYLNTRDPYNPKRGVLVPDPERFQLLQRGWEMLLRDCYTVAQVLDKLNNEWSFRTRPTRKRGGVPLTISHGYKLFSNIFYAGYILHEGRLRQGSHPPMVTVGEFNRVQTILRQRRKPGTRPQFLFKGLLHCGYCGQMVTAEQHWKNGRRLVYYRCSDSFKRCTKQGIREERLEEQILRLLERITLEPELCRIALESIVAWQESCR